MIPRNNNRGIEPEIVMNSADLNHFNYDFKTKIRNGTITEKKFANQITICYQYIYKIFNKSNKQTNRQKYNECNKLF